MHVLRKLPYQRVYSTSVFVNIIKNVGRVVIIVLIIKILTCCFFTS